MFWMIDTNLTLTAIYGISKSWIILIELNVVQEPSNIWLLISIDWVQLFFKFKKCSKYEVSTSGARFRVEIRI